MKNLNSKEINKIVQKVSKGNYQSRKEVQSAISQGNEKLQIDNKLIKMLVQETFKIKFKEMFFNSFSGGNEKITLAALMQLIAVGIIEGEDDEITDASQLLPNLDAIAIQYVGTYLTDFKRRYELVVSNYIYTRAFTSDTAFNNFLSLYLSQLNKALSKELFEYAIVDIYTNIKNVKDLGTFTDIGKFMQAVFNELADWVPYTTTANLGALNGATTIQAKDTANPQNSVGIDTSQVVKLNSTETSANVEGKTFMYENLNIILATTLHERYNNEILPIVFTNDYMSLERRFGNTNILHIPKGVLSPLPTGEIEVVVISKDAYILANGVESLQEQLWAKGEGDGLMQKVLHNWSTLGLIPFQNGMKFTATISSLVKQGVKI